MDQREWGRIGSPGTVRTTSFERQQDAQKAEQSIIKRRLSHGYTPGAHRASSVGIFLFASAMITRPPVSVRRAGGLRQGTMRYRRRYPLHVHPLHYCRNEENHFDHRRDRRGVSSWMIFA